MGLASIADGLSMLNSGLIKGVMSSLGFTAVLSIAISKFIKDVISALGLAAGHLISISLIISMTILFDSPLGLASSSWAISDVEASAITISVIISISLLGFAAGLSM